MKITIWTASADADGGTQGESFASERDAQDWIIALLDDDASRDDYDAWQARGDAVGFFDYVTLHRRDNLDTFNIDSKEIEVEVPRVVVVANISGGILQGASANMPCDVIVVDYDNDCDDAATNVVQSDGSFEEATVEETGCEVDPEWVAKVAALLAEREREES